MPIGGFRDWLIKLCSVLWNFRLFCELFTLLSLCGILVYQIELYFHRIFCAIFCLKTGTLWNNLVPRNIAISFIFIPSLKIVCLKQRSLNLFKKFILNGPRLIIQYGELSWVVNMRLFNMRFWSSFKHLWFRSKESCALLISVTLDQDRENELGNVIEIYTLHIYCSFLDMYISFTAISVFTQWDARSVWFVVNFFVFKVRYIVQRTLEQARERAKAQDHRLVASDSNICSGLSSHNFKTSREFCLLPIDFARFGGGFRQVCTCILCKNIH